MGAFAIVHMGWFSFGIGAFGLIHVGWVSFGLSSYEVIFIFGRPHLEKTRKLCINKKFHFIYTEFFYGSLIFLCFTDRNRSFLAILRDESANK